ncbi:MAG: 50S ribosomal protein L35 [Salinisphaera sp.]|nr:50S ribosomal protein L35 [Salinisphaera sp.]MDN5938765.1 50S ribosomal protein L35 [Salinisphaera sp.]
MPKLKTNRGAAKRFKRTGSGKLRRRRANANHILTKKSAKRKRRLAQGADIAAVDQPAIDRLIPYT